MLLVYKLHKSVLFGSRISKLIQKSLNALESIVKKLKAFIHMAKSNTQGRLMTAC